MLNSRFLVDFILIALAALFYVLHWFIAFDGEVIYTIDFILILSIIFYAIATSSSFEPIYPFLANNWDNYAARRSSILKTTRNVEGSSTTLFALLTVKQLVCTETAKVGTKVLETTTKTNLISTLI